MVVILGGGESGIGAALLAHQKGVPVFVSDSGEIKEKHQLVEHDIPFEEGGHDIDKLLKASEIVISPGVPPDAPALQMARANRIRIISEIEWACRFFEGTIIAVTGTNGKSTTTNLIWHLLDAGGFNAIKGGNLGESFSRILTRTSPDVAVLEISSFQLENIEDFKPYISVWLNLTSDHLDRYQYSIHKYAETKYRITLNQDENDWFVYDGASQIIEDCIESDPRPVHHHPILPGQWGMGWATPTEDVRFTLRNPMLKGRHNAFNACCATWVALKMGVSEITIVEALDTFVNDPHRLEPVGDHNGVHFINDSKATNVEAVQFALEGISPPIIWIAGGTDKGNDYSSLVKVVGDKVQGLVCLGVDNTALKDSFGEVVPRLKETRSMEEAVEIAAGWAVPGATVLLSPACASFDLFTNYKDRGEQFKAAVRKLK